jgi:hypothetical protein
MWIAGTQALHGHAASLYEATGYTRIPNLSAGTGHISVVWTYPPTFFLLLAPLAMLPYLTAFLTWTLVTLLGCVVIICLIVRRPHAIPLVLASPFTPRNIFLGQNGFLTASLLGAALLFLERRPIVAGVFIGCLSYKPQFGILLPVALVASARWRAVASAGVTGALLAGGSAASFGMEAWASFPGALTAFSTFLFADPDAFPAFAWGQFQSVFGLVRTLHGSAAVASLAQAATTAGVAIIVWLVWRSSTRYALKAATLSAGALLTTPYIFAYDMAAVAVAVAFVVSDQMRCGMLRGEQTILAALFATCLGIYLFTAFVPIGPILIITLLAVILRRVLQHSEERSLSCEVTPSSLKIRENFETTFPVDD